MFHNVTAVIAKRETPGHIPNPEAKPFSADGTAPARVWESRTPPNNHSANPFRATPPVALKAFIGRWTRVAVD